MAAPYQTTGGYGGNSSLIVDPASGLASSLVDTADGYPTLYPQLVAGGGLAPFVVNPVPINPSIGMPEINAIITELRVLTALLHSQMGTFAPDLQIMRADEGWNTTISTGAL